MDHDTSPDTAALYPPPQAGTALAMPQWRADIARQLGPSDIELTVALSPAELWNDGRPDLAHNALQLRRAFAWIQARTCQDPDQVRARAAVIAAARVSAPTSELELGLRHAPAELAGQQVTCRRCATSWGADIYGGDYWDGATADTGLCFGCALAETRTDAQLCLTVPVLIPDRVIPPQQPAAPDGGPDAG